jgi:hypothetical protein
MGQSESAPVDYVNRSRVRRQRHSFDDDSEEYLRLRGLARAEARASTEASRQSQVAYKRGEGHLAKQLSDKRKEHDRLKQYYNKQAADFIFLGTFMRSKKLC